MKLLQDILFFIMFLSLSACHPVEEEPTENTSPSADLLTQVITPTPTGVWLLPITEQGEKPATIQPTKTATDIPEVTKETIIPETQGITITIVYDNYLDDQRLSTDWGFSALIELADYSLLFDTGANGLILLQNMKILGIDPLQIDSVVLSHAHNDHTGGLRTLLNTGAKPTVYLLPSFPISFIHLVEMFTDVIEVSPGFSIVEGIWTTGEMGVEIPEQTLVVESEHGLVVITGCAHPGIIDILEQVSDMKRMPLYMVLGGFHLGGKSVPEIDAILQDFRRLDVMYVAPCHCTGDVAIEKFLAEYGNNYLKIGAGSLIKLQTSVLQ